MASASGRKYTLTLPGFHISCWVTVGGQPLEVCDACVEGTVAKGTIEPVDGKKFAVHWVEERRKEPQAPYEVSLFVDNVDCNGTVTARDDRVFRAPLSSEERIVSYEGKEELDVRSGLPYWYLTLEAELEAEPHPQGLFSHFSFKSPNSPNLPAGFSDDFDKLGTIELRYYRIKDMVVSPDAAASSAASSCLANQDRALAPSHGIVFEDAVPGGNMGPLIEFRRIDLKRKPLSSVQFRYSSARPTSLATSAAPVAASSRIEDVSQSPSLESARWSLTPNPPPSPCAPPPSKKELRRLKMLEARLAKLREIEAVKEDCKKVKREEEEEVEGGEGQWNEAIRPAKKTRLPNAGGGEQRVKQEEEVVVVRSPVKQGTGTGKNGEIEVLEVDI
ncbi:hypothetical protein JCM11251_000250 [Rhodosporidiobolus azoricus]